MRQRIRDFLDPPEFVRAVRNRYDYLAYLGQPFGHTEESVMEYRYKAALRTTRWLLHHGIHVYSPIVYGYHLIKDDPEMIALWKGGGSAFLVNKIREMDERNVLKSSELIVLKLEGWQQSYGLDHEMSLADKNGILRTDLPELTEEELNECPFNP